MKEAEGKRAQFIKKMLYSFAVESKNSSLEKIDLDADACANAISKLVSVEVTTSVVHFLEKISAAEQDLVDGFKKAILKSTQERV